MTHEVPHIDNPKWFCFAEVGGLEKVSRVRITGSDAFSVALGNNRDEIEDLESFYGHFTGNPSQMGMAGVTPERLKQVWQRLNVLHEESVGKTYDEIVSEMKNIRAWIEEQPDEVKAAESLEFDCIRRLEK